MNLIDYKNVELNDGFLHQKQVLNENVTIDAVYNRFYDTGRISAFECNRKEGEENEPHCFWDSDVAKWMEGVAYILCKKRDEELEAKVESLIDQIEKNQWDDGYFNIHFTVCKPNERFTIRHYHELYCAGHLFEAAVAYYEATGRDRFLKLMEKYADYIEKVFIIDKSAAFVTPGHEEIELALVKMYRTTGKKKYLDMAKHFVDKRGYADEKEKEYQSHLPVREQTTAEGHAVRACYLFSAMADLALETNDKELTDACKILFENIVSKRMYVTGGIGSTRVRETFTLDYDLINDKAYAETCAAISLMFFAHRMMRLENDAKYADIIERVLYNGMIAGLSLGGNKFFYENPLEINDNNYKRYVDEKFNEQYAIRERVEVFTCSCCPPNLNRVLASLGSYIYGSEGKTIYVNQFAGSVGKFDGMKIVQKTDFPKSGKITFECEGAQKLCVRIPSWCDEYKISAPFEIENGYAVIENPESKTEVEFVMKPFLVVSNPEIYENNGKVAVCVGPFVCCAEGIDNDENLHSYFIDKNLDASFEYSDELCGFKVKAKAFKRPKSEKLYSRYEEVFEESKLNLIPFASFANRGETNMCVWLNVR